MHIRKLDHVNVRTTQLEAMADWYARVLGMRRGDRPDFPFPGAWMYVADHPAVHLVGIDGAPATGSETALKLEHFAFTASDRAGFEAKLIELDETYRISIVPDFGITQFNIWDPDGNHIHVDFSGEDPDLHTIGLTTRRS